MNEYNLIDNVNNNNFNSKYYFLSNDLLKKLNDINFDENKCVYNNDYKCDLVKINKEIYCYTKNL